MAAKKILIKLLFLLIELKELLSGSEFTLAVLLLLPFSIMAF